MLNKKFSRQKFERRNTSIMLYHVIFICVSRTFDVILLIWQYMSTVGLCIYIMSVCVWGPPVKFVQACICVLNVSESTFTSDARIRRLYRDYNLSTFSWHSKSSSFSIRALFQDGFRKEWFEDPTNQPLQSVRPKVFIMMSFYNGHMDLVNCCR